MESTANGDKKRKKEKNKNIQQRSESDEIEDIKKKKKKKQRLQPQAEPPPSPMAAREVEDKVMEKQDKKKNKKMDKKKKERDQENGCEPESAGDVVEEKRNSLITDPRFSSAHFDPRFQRMPKRESKVSIDSRFTRMFSDKNFSTSSAPVDKRGKSRKGKGVNPLLHYYLHQDEEGKEETETKEEQFDELREESPELPTKASSSESEPEVLEEEEGEEEEDFAESGRDESTSTTDEEDDDDDEVILLPPCFRFNAERYQIPFVFTIFVKFVAFWF